MKKFLCLILFMLMLANLSLAQKQAPFEIRDIRLDGKVQKYEVVDLNGDSLREIIAITKHGKGKAARQKINILWHTEFGFSQERLQTLTPNREFILFDFGDVTDDPGRELVFLTSTGFFYFSLNNNFQYELTKKLLFSEPSIFKNNEKREIRHWKFVKDINGDGRDEIIVPQFYSCLFYARNDSNKWKKKAKLNLPAKTKIQNYKTISVNYSHPDLYFNDCNCDGYTDVIARADDQFLIFFQQPSGEYPEQPDLTFDMQFIPDEEKPSEEIKIETIKDINGDGVVDLLANKISARESLLNPQSQMQIYFGKLAQKRLWSLTPDQIIVASGIQFDEELIDLNNDGKLDLAVPSIKLGLMRIIKMLLTKSVTMGIKIYQMENQGIYPQQPDIEKNLTLKFDFSVGANEADGSGTIPVFNLKGDFNNDKYLDLISALDQKKFQIYYGEPGNIFSNSSQLDFDVQLPKNGDQLKLFDLDNNGKTDIIINYRKQDDKSGEMQQLVRILINKL